MESLSREFGLPKHLFPINDGKENPTSRLIRQLQGVSGRVCCVVNPGQKNLFSRHVPGHVEIVEKDPLAKAFIGDLEAVLTRLEKDSPTTITTGDLVFRDPDMESFISGLRRGEDHLKLVTDPRFIKTRLPLRLAHMRSSLIEEFIKKGINPEDISSMLRFLFSHISRSILQGRSPFGTIKILANLNTPEDYEKVRGNLPL